MKRSDNTLWIFLLLVAAAAGGAWYYWQQLNRSPVETAIPAPDDTAPEVAPKTGPVHPLELSPPSSENRQLVPLPALDDLDAYLRLELIGIFGDTLDALLANEALIDRIVATIDNLPRSRVAERIRPVGRLANTFTVETDGADDAYILSPANFDRYTFLIDALQYADLESMVDLYRRYYPVFQKAYVQLGYPDGYFNDRVIEVIDHLLETPTAEQPIRLVSPHVLYEFADANTEALSSGQKLMLRIGEQHATALRNVLIAFRARIASQ